MTQSIYELVPVNPGCNRMTSDRNSVAPYHWLMLPDSIRGQQEIWNHLAAQEDPWPHFLLWESEWQTRQGIERLRRAPFLTWGNLDQSHSLLLAQVYPNAVKAAELSFTQDTAYVTAAVRQAREYYQAAMTVSELTRPTLLYYSALMLVRAAIVALLGSDALRRQSGHGQKCKSPRNSVDENALKNGPILISWQRTGDFVALYHLARWDGYWASLDGTSIPWPRFHIMECLGQTGVIGSPAVITRSQLPLDHLLWTHEEDTAERLPTTLQHVLETPCFEVPHLVPQFMVLFYFGVMARYHPVAWQELLARQSEEGYYFRKAMGEIPSQFVRAMQEFLPHPYSIPNPSGYSVVQELPDPRDLQNTYKLSVDILGHLPKGYEKGD